MTQDDPSVASSSHYSKTPNTPDPVWDWTPLFELRAVPTVPYRGHKTLAAAYLPTTGWDMTLHWTYLPPGGCLL
jgi:hypothetical protein